MTATALRLDRVLIEWWWTLFVAAVLVSACVASGLTQRFDWLIYDLAQRSQHHDPNPEILLVAIDDRSLAEVGPWPWPRATQARLLEALAKGKPRSVALDLLLIDRGDPAGDAQLSAAIAGGAPTYLPVLFTAPGKNGSEFDVLTPLDVFAKSASGLAQANLAPDQDGIVRRIYLDYSDGKQSWPHLMTRLAGLPSSAGSAPQSVHPKGSLIASEPAMISFAGPQGSFPAIAASSVLRGEVPNEAIAGRMTLVGVTASGVGDAYATPSTSDRALMPGLEIQANLLDSILSSRLVKPASGLVLYLFAIIPFLILLLAMRGLPPSTTIWLFVVLLCLVIGGSIGLLVLKNLWIGPGSALLGLLVVYPLWSWRRLSAISAYIGGELEKLDGESDPLERERPTLRRNDFIGRQAGLLHSAIDRERDMRRFLIDRIAQMPDAVFVTSADGRVVISNNAALVLWRSLGGRDAPDRVNVVLDLLAIESDGQTYDFAALAPWQLDARTDDGRSFSVRFEPQRAADETPIGAVVRIADMTEARLAQRQREDVLQLLSHDMRAPQVSILTILGGKEAANLEPGLLARLRASAERTLELADGFVQLARAQSLVFEPQPVDIGDVILEAADSLWPQAQLREVEVRTIAPVAEIFVPGDHSLLRRMLVNLIDNAIHYSPPGGKVVVKAMTGQDLSDLPNCSITVLDKGNGMSDEQAERLFEKFNTGGGHFGVTGVGMGLAFVQTAVKRHGGQISLDTRKGHGTCFTVTLPICSDPA